MRPAIHSRQRRRGGGFVLWRRSEAAWVYRQAQSLVEDAAAVVELDDELDDPEELDESEEEPLEDPFEPAAELDERLSVR